MRKSVILLLAIAFSVSSFAQESITVNKLKTNYLYVGRLDGDTEPNSYWSTVSRLEYAGHNLVIGSGKGAYAHNMILLKPGGSSLGEIYSGLDIFRAINETNHVRVIRFIGAKGHDNFINNGGRLGVGTDTPQSMLDVRGKIIADEVQIKVNIGADFVFQPDYNLKPLSEVEQFVKTNKHLPEIPSERQMIEDGVNVNDMQIKLLQKIEELTLYMIEQDKRIDELEKQLNKK